MKKLTTLVLAAAIVLAGVFFSLQAGDARAKGVSIMEFDTMVGVPKAYTGVSNPIRGINGGGLPWVIGAAEGELKQSGNLEVSVTGLVLNPNDPDVIARGLAGQNPIPNFRAIVSCQSLDASGNANVVNLSTGLFPATTGPASSGGGNAKIEAHVDLPKPCIAPIIFVASPANAWFAVTGN